nr:transposase [Cytophagales bacterium]
DELVKNLKHCQARESLEIFAYVIMTSHVHLLCRRTEGLLSELLGRFKGYTAKQIINQIRENQQESRKKWLLQAFAYHAKSQEQNAENMFWQKTSHPIEVITPEMFRQKMDYIHNNPLAAGIVTDPSYYCYSSANPMSPLKMNDY